MQYIVLDEVFPLSIQYALAVGARKAEDLLETFSELFPEHKKTTMTAARQLEKRGEIRGKKEGEIIGIQTRNIQIARNMLLKLHLDIDIVQKATELPKAELEQILRENNK